MPHECTTCGRQFDDGSKEMLSGCPNCGGNKFQFQPAGRGGSSEESSASTATADSTADEPEATNTAPAVDDSTTEEVSAAGTAPAADDAGATDDAAAAGPDTDRRVDADGSADAGDWGDAEIADEVGEENRAQSDARSASASHDEINEARRRTAEATEERLSAVEGGPRGTTQGPPTEPPSSEETEAFDISGAVGPDDADPVEKQPVGGSTGEPAEPVTDDDADLSALREELNDQFESIKITAPGQYELNLMELYDRREYIISLQEDGRYVIEMAEDYGMEDA